MICEYKEYLDSIKSITFEECCRLHQEIILEVGKDEDAVEIYDLLIAKATDYIVLRSQWTLHDRVWKQGNDRLRTSTHDVLISYFDVLAKYLRSMGKKADWRDNLGDVDMNPHNRKKIGDFACYLAFVHALNGR